MDELKLEDREELDDREPHKVPYTYQDELRRSTDMYFLLGHLVFYVVLLASLSYTLYYADMDRLYGYDDYGNVCGKKNEKYPDLPESGKDFSNKKYLAFQDDFSLTCVEECNMESEYLELAVCINDTNVFQGSSSFGIKNGRIIAKNIMTLLRVSFFASVLSIAYLFIVSKFSHFCVWAVMVFIGLILFVQMCFCWEEGGIVISLIFTVLTAGWIAFLYFRKKRINLITTVFRDAGAAIFSMPMILLHPLLNVLCIIVVIAIFIPTSILLETAGRLQKVNDYKYEYIPDGLMSFTKALNIIGFIWMLTFIIACHRMTVAGAVSRWYFVRNKEELQNPIANSFKTLIKYHLGTASFSSLLSAVIAITSLFIRRRTGCCPGILIKTAEHVNASGTIITAMFGHKFTKACKMAFAVILNRFLDVISLKFLGNFVLGVGFVFLVILSMLPDYSLLRSDNGEHTLLAIIAILLIYMEIKSFITLFKAAVDTIFLCISVDIVINKGDIEKCYMTDTLKEFCYQSKEVPDITDAPPPYTEKAEITQV